MDKNVQRILEVRWDAAVKPFKNVKWVKSGGKRLNGVTKAKREG